ncbi:MAG: Unknown protein [uncultured Sulfurovum sp.]|uniref:Uncharacterized protein n=1 Tax=uncultured Sulfurovum sp. TaxID=269237 RepID=A0A6S6SG96_9BACT|nr:MAG: Unknown protein [uncultured Sulfurovum sp.]
MKNLLTLLSLLGVILVLSVTIAVLTVQKANANELPAVADNSKQLQLEKEVKELADKKFDDEKFNSRLSTGNFSCTKAKLDRKDLESILLNKEKASKLSESKKENYEIELKLVWSLIETKCEGK